MKSPVITFVLSFTSTLLLAQKNDTINLYFDLNQTVLTEVSTKTIDDHIKSGILDREKKLTILGFGDYLGSDDYNNNLSYIRAKNTLDYLVLAGFKKEKSTLVIGKGKISGSGKNGKQGNAIDRKVAIIFAHRPDTPAKEKFGHYLQRLKLNDETYPLHDIHFFRGSTSITPQSSPAIQLLANFLIENKTWKIQLEGHVCCLGPRSGKDEPYLESTLSQKRAESIRDSLVAHGVRVEKIICVGLGNNDPLNDEETIEEQELNRRVEIRVLER